MELAKRYRGSLLGLAAGDALGTTVEFNRREHFLLSAQLRAVEFFG